MKKQILAIFLPLIFAANAHALFELRAGYGINTPSETNLTNGSTLSTMAGFNLDAILEVPMLPFGLGLRYESMGADVEQPGSSFSTDMTRMALLINYRIIDLFAYFGVIGTVGFANDVTVNGTPAGDLSYDADMTYSIGVEGGVSLGMMMVGAELGYNMAKYENTNNTPAEVPFDGIYAKAIVGVGF